MIKHDPRVERPEARGDGDWGVVRDACPTLSGARLPGTRGCSGSMDGRRRAGADVPRPGRSFTASWKAQLDLGCPGAGARVRGGAAPTGADRQQYQERSRLSHGGGAGPVVGAHERYDRFSMDRVVRIPAIIARVDEGDGAAPPPGMLLAWVAAMRTTSPRSRRRTWALARRR